MEEKSAFITIIGRPNVGKSSLMNRALGQKVAIVSDKPQTDYGRADKAGNTACIY